MRRLDNENDFKYTAVFIPLHIAIVMLMVSTVTRRPGNPCKCHNHSTHTSVDIVCDTVDIGLGTHQLSCI